MNAPIPAQPPEPQNSGRGTLRQRILASVGALVLLSLLGSSLSLYRITEVNRSLDAINRVSVPLGVLLVQMQSDGEVYRRELERRMGHAHWPDRHWRARPMPRWIEEVIESEADRARELVSKDLPWTTSEMRGRWREWVTGVASGFAEIKEGTGRLYQALEQEDDAKAQAIYPKLTSNLEEWARQLQWGVGEYERSLRRTFSHAESRVAELRTGLEIILVVVVSLSLLLLWLGERALRPLGELTRFAREIASRGLRREDKLVLPEAPLSRKDEVSRLTREFRRMATTLLEREKTVETQKSRLQEQNRLLREIGELNRNILHSIRSVLIVTDLEGRITQCNPVACRWLGREPEQIIGTAARDWPQLEPCLSAHREIKPFAIGGRVYGGKSGPLHGETGEAYGSILVLEDLTDDIELQERLRIAENFAAIGRMSAQVAHEVRNPLHSIGLEAEMAAEMAAKLGNPALKQSLQSILGAVDRLEKITENYLRLTRLSSGEKTPVDLGEVLESVLATYASACESQGVRVDWSREAGASLRVRGDRDLLEQALGNLLRNALQALESARSGKKRPLVSVALGSAESGRVWLRIEDNGPGISPEIRERLFTPFVTTRANGTGLGLSFVKRVVEEHGGTIECKGDRGGACFEIVLPREGAPREARAPRREEAPLNA